MPSRAPPRLPTRSYLATTLERAAAARIWPALRATLEAALAQDLWRYGQEQDETDGHQACDSLFGLHSTSFLT